MMVDNNLSNCGAIQTFYLIYGSTILCWTLVAFSLSSSYTQSVGLLGQEISPSQGSYLLTGQHQHRIIAHRYLYLEWDSKPRSQCMSGRRQFMS
jgi:hypothetical protein